MLCQSLRLLHSLPDSLNWISILYFLFFHFLGDFINYYKQLNYLFTCSRSVYPRFSTMRCCHLLSQSRRTSSGFGLCRCIRGGSSRCGSYFCLYSSVAGHRCHQKGRSLTGITHQGLISALLHSVCFWSKYFSVANRWTE